MGKLDVHSFHPGAESPPCPSVSHSTLILSAQPSRSSGSILLCLYKSSSHRGFGRVCVSAKQKPGFFFFFFFLNKSTHAESLHVLTLHRSNNYTCFVFFSYRHHKRSTETEEKYNIWTECRVCAAPRAKYEYSCRVYVCRCYEVCRGGFL